MTVEEILQELRDASGHEGWKHLGNESYELKNDRVWMFCCWHKGGSMFTEEPGWVASCKSPRFLSDISGPHDTPGEAIRTLMTARAGEIIAAVECMPAYLRDAISVHFSD